MSRSKRARSKARRASARAVASTPAPAPKRRPAQSPRLAVAVADAPTRGASETRIQAAGQRARRVKRTVAVAGTLVFGMAMLLARASYAGHVKRAPKPLAAPPRFITVVRKNLLQAGVVGPAQAPPEAITGAS